MRASFFSRNVARRKQNGIEDTTRLAGGHHVDEELGEDLGVLPHRGGEGMARLDVVQHFPEDLGEGRVLRLVSQNVQALHERKARVDHRRELSREYHDVASRDPRTKLKRQLPRLLPYGNRDHPLLVEKGEDVLLVRKIDLALFDVATRRRAGTPVVGRHLVLPTPSLGWSC